MNLSIEKINNNIENLNNIFNINALDDIFCLKLGDKIIGYSRIVKNSNNNPFEIYIIEQYRGNGYSKYFFKQMIKELQKFGYNEAFFKVSGKDYIFKRLIEQNKGLRISQDYDITTYVIPINN